MIAQKTETEWLKTQGDFYFDDNGDYLARFYNGVVYYRGRLNGKPLTGPQVSEVNLWAIEKKADILHKVDDSDFKAHDAGGEKLIRENELDKVMTESRPVAFKFCEEAVKLIDSLVWRIHILEKHADNVKDPEYLSRDCNQKYCADVNNFFARIDSHLFHGTMGDLTGIEPPKPVVGEG